jgi:hypothetical protein
MSECLLTAITGKLRAEVCVHIDERSLDILTTTDAFKRFVADIFIYDGGVGFGGDGAMKKLIGMVHPNGRREEIWLYVDSPFSVEKAFFIPYVVGDKQEKEVVHYDAATLLGGWGAAYMFDHQEEFEGLSDDMYLGALLKSLTTGDVPWSTLLLTPLPVTGTVRPLNQKGSYDALIGFGLLMAGDQSIVYLTADGYSSTRPEDSVPMVVPKGVVERPLQMN